MCEIGSVRTYRSRPAGAHEPTAGSLRGCLAILGHARVGINLHRFMVVHGSGIELLSGRHSCGLSSLGMSLAWATEKLLRSREVLRNRLARNPSRSSNSGAVTRTISTRPLAGDTTVATVILGATNFPLESSRLCQHGLASEGLVDRAVHDVLLMVVKSFGGRNTSGRDRRQFLGTRRKDKEWCLCLQTCLAERKVAGRECQTWLTLKGSVQLPLHLGRLLGANIVSGSRQPRQVWEGDTALLACCLARNWGIKVEGAGETCQSQILRRRP